MKTILKIDRPKEIPIKLSEGEMILNEYLLKAMYKISDKIFREVYYNENNAVE